MPNGISASGWLPSVLSLNPWIDDFGWSSVGFGELRWGVGALAHA
jgi:hypothetical protein